MALNDEEHLRALHETIGAAISGWANVERALCQVFLYAIGAPNNTVHTFTAAAAFNSILSFKTKMQITETALLVSYRGEPILDEWKTLRNRIERKEKMRNFLAHCALVSTDSGYAVSVAGLYIHPNRARLHSLSDVKRITDAINECWAEITIFVDRLSQH